MGDRQMTPEQVQELKGLEAKATPGPWGWRSYGEKVNAATLGTFVAMDDAYTPLAGRVECERWDDRKGEYIQCATDDEQIAYKEDNASFSDFEFIAALRNHAPALIAAAERDEQWTQIIADETAETMRLMEALGVVEDVKNGTACMDAMLAKIRQLRRENERLRAVAEAAKTLQRACSRSGMTEGHSCKCDECQAWFSVNAALKALEAP